ncbi:hypothetical protein SAMN02745216_01199 [Desulfatibacillum alkenivorans DSM 16219]|jgi:hypothetical protein|uniref:Methyltransferase domain-containing protein n=1 Tax=Desulfatibacillum alkenivorans DSM 16219 TaxID=1121393 RepID=A0A1M6HE24_9BACT|nr:hypothetical protein [Desulfatibacillum alkenivorans]SHJ20393.1 hypothetical protein SAMN02745216_01199 [Desulfatibacillum alkenivorans DSM 16219]
MSLYKNLKPAQLTVLDKKEIIDFALGRLSPSPCSFADLGGIWDVDGEYTFHAFKNHDIKRAFLVDTDFTDKALTKAEKHPALQTIQDNFGRQEVVEKIGPVDAVFMFDVLLHQVSPDWDQILEMYSRICSCFVIFNQQWTREGHTVRLLDLGEKEYFANVPHDPEHPNYKGLFDRLDEIHPQHERKIRDIHNIWQWGISDKDLIAKMEAMGFGLQYYKNCGQFQNLKHFYNHAFVFSKRRAG